MAPVIKILVLRFSAMGDVALLVPVLRSAVSAHPNIWITVVTRPRFAAFFADIERVSVFAADVDLTYKRVGGMLALFKALRRKGSYDLVIDMHDHIRTVILRTLFRLSSTQVFVFEKGRKAKKAYARKHNKVPATLPHTVERYQAAFAKAGVAFNLLPPPCFHPNKKAKTEADAWLQSKGLQKREAWIGIAPFAMHATKIWPTGNYAAVIASVLREMPARFFLFGGGATEIRFFETLQLAFPDACVLAAGQLTIQQEIALMQQLDVMLCVDSANMHLASLAGVPVLSIWGGTHPDLGFAPLGDKSTVIQISRTELPCRPCSVYGRATCYIGGFPCLTRITPALVASRVMDKIVGNR